MNKFVLLLSRDFGAASEWEINPAIISIEKKF